MAYRVPTRCHSNYPSSMSASQPNPNPNPPPPASSHQQLLTAEDPKNPQSCVTCIYQTQIGGYWRNVTVLWTKNLMNHSLIISVDSVSNNQQHQMTCKIDLKPWHFWSKRGYKSFAVDGNHLDAFWDLRSAKFASGGPEPCADYYVALVSEEEVVLLLGDYKKKAYKRTKSRPALVDAVLFFKKEHVFGKKSFSTRAKFDQRKKDHDIVVESSTSGPKEPEMWISIDGIVLIHVKNLQWKFRGNETVLVNKQPVQVFWDVHAWLFCTPPGSSHGLFIFKPGAPDDDDKDDEVGSGCTGGSCSDCSEDTRYYSTLSHSNASSFCLFLYAWKIE